MDFLIIPAQLNRLNTLKDGTISIVFETQELSPNDIGQLYALRMKLCYVAIKPETFSAKEKEIVGELEAEIQPNGKTPGQRLRNVLYRLWEQNSEGYADFNLFYINRIDKLINQIKDKLQ